MAGFGPAREGVKVPCLTAWLHPCIFSHRLPAALCLPTSHQELGNYASRLILSFLRFLARWPGWYGIAVLPCFSASGKVPVTRCGLPLRGTYAAYVQLPLRLSHAHARLRPRKHFRRFQQSRQGGRIPTRSFQQALSFSVRRSAYSHIIRVRPGIWQGRLGIEPTQAVLETASPALEHSPLYPAFAYPPERVRVLSNARFNAGKSNGPSRSHALLTGHNARQVRACRNIAPVRCQLWDLAQTAGLEPAHTSWCGALPTELRLHIGAGLSRLSNPIRVPL